MRLRAITIVVSIAVVLLVAAARFYWPARLEEVRLGAARPRLLLPPLSTERMVDDVSRKEVDVITWLTGRGTYHVAVDPETGRVVRILRGGFMGWHKPAAFFLDVTALVAGVYVLLIVCARSWGAMSRSRP
jgi:hypothetical protein